MKLGLGAGAQLGKAHGDAEQRVGAWPAGRRPDVTGDRSSRSVGGAELRSPCKPWLIRS